MILDPTVTPQLNALKFKVQLLFEKLTVKFLSVYELEVLFQSPQHSEDHTMSQFSPIYNLTL